MEWYPHFLEISKNKSILDIGCGNIPVFPHATPFDIENGDANNILSFVKQDFDIVFSSHCLEHMLNPVQSVKDWFSLVRQGGYMVIIVPNELLYEQCYWPSLFNSDHKFSFRSETKPNNPIFSNSYSIEQLLSNLSGYKLISLTVDDSNYDRNLIANSRLRTRFVWLEQVCLRKLLVSRNTLFKLMGQSILKTMNIFGIPFDQTLGDAVAQITFIIQKVDTLNE
jgi:hypothetical protein